jgi:hypothetical protein
MNYLNEFCRQYFLGVCIYLWIFFLKTALTSFYSCTFESLWRSHIYNLVCVYICGYFLKKCCNSFLFIYIWIPGGQPFLLISIKTSIYLTLPYSTCLYFFPAFQSFRINTLSKPSRAKFVQNSFIWHDNALRDFSTSSYLLWAFFALLFGTCSQQPVSTQKWSKKCSQGRHNENRLWIDQSEMPKGYAPP